MHQGNWKCSSCGGTITELPFEPKSESGLTCRTCWSKNKDKEKQQAGAPEMSAASEPQPDIPEDAGLAGEPMPADDGFDAAPVTRGEKAKFEGDWKCSGCGAAITSLPFEPRSTNNLKCIDCFKQSKA